MRFNYFEANHRHRLVLIAFFVIGLLCSSSFPQTPPREKPKLKDFGSSLKKLKWDAEKNQTVNNVQPAPDGNHDDDVIRIETSLVVCDVYEHAFYVDYQNKKADYVDRFLQYIDWDVWERCLKVEEAERASLLDVVAAWKGVRQ